MKLLLDTHILVWLTTNDERLSSVARALLSDANNECFFSPVSIAEIALKHKKHPEYIPFDGASARAAFLSAGCTELTLSAKHCKAIDSMNAFHSDPIDRMLLAQARSEEIKIMSHDRQFPQYGDFVIHV